MPTANPSDVATLDAILHTFYETVSGAAGQPRDGIASELFSFRKDALCR